MIKTFLLSISLIFFLISCVKEIENISLINEENKKKVENINKSDLPKYLIGEPYLIENVNYIPEENYKYSEIGTASFFDIEFHGKKTSNNEIINITKLTGSHKTLPLPSIVKVTNLENEISLIIRINNRGPYNNEDIIMLSKQAAKLLGFHNKFKTKVKVEIMEVESIRVKNAALSVTDVLSDQDIIAVPKTTVNPIKVD
ncbi:MAG: septal ring lytic transglycosylase RlpA family lipoprotein [Pelagibacteraceae bacterium]|nr:septal ring lytic transglycosylase RlpA family lipoprotein [Pelagibacteraceae bacterium]|tara:strand:+ start:1240 stop:1839 length:600 start_codon:yes stop_codon:yes gene_type:complete